MHTSLAKLRFVVPNIATAFNLFLGFYSITETLHGNYWNAASCILAGIAVDMGDGGLARGLSAASNFGKEFDSLADLAVFGVALSVLLYQQCLGSLGFGGLLLSFLPTLGAALRLASFNIRHSVGHFRGVPTPAAAGLLAGYLLISAETGSSIPINMNLLTLLICTVCILMVSPIPFPRTFQIRRIDALNVTMLAVAVFTLWIGNIPATVYFASALTYVMWGIGAYCIRYYVSAHWLRKPAPVLKEEKPISSPQLSHDPQHGQ